MWVADMDFKAPQAVNYALIKRAEHGIYGYTFTDSKVRDSIVHWIKKRFDWDVNEDWLSFSPGVVTTLHMAIQTFTNPGDNVLIQRSEEHTSELQSRFDLVCRLLLE